MQVALSLLAASVAILFAYRAGCVMAGMPAMLAYPAPTALTDWGCLPRTTTTIVRPSAAQKAP